MSSYLIYFQSSFQVKGTKRAHSVMFSGGFFFQMRPTKWVDILLISSFFSGEANKVSSNLNISQGCFTVRWANWIHTLLYSKVFLRQGEQSEFSPFCFPKVFVRWGEQSEFTPYCFPKVSLRWGERSDLTPYCFPKIFFGSSEFSDFRPYCFLKSFWWGDRIEFTHYCFQGFFSGEANEVTSRPVVLQRFP